MVSDNSVIKAPISTTDIGTVLQTSSHDVGTLCTHDNINKWAKYKPVRYSTVQKLTEEQLKSTNYGLAAYELTKVATNINKSFSRDDSITTLVGTPTEWPYRKPTGNASSPYRMGDFLNATDVSEWGYNKTAVAPANGFPEQFDITEQQINNKQIQLGGFNMKFGESAYEGVGNTAGIQIPLNDLNLLANNPINNGNWRVGLVLLIPVTNTNSVLRIVTSSGPIKQISSVNASQDIASMLVDFNQSEFTLDNLEAALNSTTNFTDIPYVPILMYGAQVDDRGTVTLPSSSRVFCMPEGNQGVVRVHKTSSTFSITINAAKIDYLNISSGSTTFNTGGITGMRKPSAANSSSCRLQMDYTFAITASSVNELYSVIPGLSSTYVYNPTSIQYEVYRDGSWQATTIDQMNRNGRYRVTAVDYYTGGTRTPIMQMLDNLPIYTGASGTEVGLGYSLRFTLKGGQVVDKSSNGTTVRMSN